MKWRTNRWRISRCCEYTSYWWHYKCSHGEKGLQRGWYLQIRILKTRFQNLSMIRWFRRPEDDLAWLPHTCVQCGVKLCFLPCFPLWRRKVVDMSSLWAMVPKRFFLALDLYYQAPCTFDKIKTDVKKNELFDFLPVVSQCFDVSDRHLMKESF